jgi:hypothetical protein
VTVVEIVRDDDFIRRLRRLDDLRIGNNLYRAFYALEGNTILVVAVGVKQRERLFIGGQEVFRESSIYRRRQGPPQ